MFDLNICGTLPTFYFVLSPFQHLHSGEHGGETFLAISALLLARFARSNPRPFTVRIQMVHVADVPVSQCNGRDACAFNPLDLFGQAKFDRIIMSYCVSMIPQWQSAIKEAACHLVPGAELHIVDFGDQSRMPRWFDRGLRNWLMRFHVVPRDDLPDFLKTIAAADVIHTSLLRSYVRYASNRQTEESSAP